MPEAAIEPTHIAPQGLPRESTVGIIRRFEIRPTPGSSSASLNSDTAQSKPTGQRVTGFDAERIDALIGPKQSERYRAYLEEIIDIEIIENLGKTRLFSPKDVKETLHTAVSPGAFKRAYGKDSLGLTFEHLMQRPPLPHSSAEVVRRLYCRQPPLFVQLTALQPTNIAIFHAMQLMGIPLKYDFSLMYSSEVVRFAEVSGSFDMCVLGIAAGAGLVNKPSSEFASTVLMARGTQRMVETVPSRTNIRSKNHLLHLGPNADSNTFWFYSHMLESQILQSKDFKCSEQSPTEFFLNALTNDVEGKTFIAFPFIHFLPPGIQVVRDKNIPTKISDKETVLFSLKGVLRDDIFMQSSLSCMFDTWLRLIESKQYRTFVIRSLCRETSYPLALLRAMGMTLGFPGVRELFSRDADAPAARMG